MVNYVLVGIGFLFLLGWAIFTGMFHDIEAPKYTMLERERELDQAARHAHHPPP
ncbi:MAG TPA: cbb3-type cytochrome oxidase assembly protein CcoS [Planctomycetaceae bacterium]|nr:cbb3-type cytochrome oxidase assembly protein CcoS [Planctomycetaceae bacterium]